MRDHFDLNEHVGSAQHLGLHARPQRLVVGHVFGELGGHDGPDDLRAQRFVPAHDLEDVFERRAGITEGDLDVLEGEVDLLLLCGTQLVGFRLGPST